MTDTTDTDTLAEARRHHERIEETLVRIEFHIADLVAVLAELVPERGKR